MLNVKECPECWGVGEVSIDLYDPNKTMTCPTCKGSGRVPAVPDTSKVEIGSENPNLWRVWSRRVGDKSVVARLDRADWTLGSGGVLVTFEDGVDPKSFLDMEWSKFEKHPKVKKVHPPLGIGARKS